MDWEKQGGAAFPAPDSPRYHAEVGMSLRDWFAGQSAAAMIGGATSAMANLGKAHAPQIASAAYFLADAMLAEREK